MSDEEQPREPEGEPTEPVPELESSPLIEKANAAAERLEKATAALAKENTRREQLAVERRLGGNAGTAAPVQEESPEEYAKKVLAGDVNVKED